ncbi:hypothetical protein EI94DRAFT_1729573 [Lactarius quietus]|nr:hypothetical protein EI94DRAFT_1729573 [Lactarius quietus]
MPIFPPAMLPTVVAAMGVIAPMPVIPPIPKQPMPIIGLKPPTMPMPPPIIAPMPLIMRWYITDISPAPELFIYMKGMVLHVGAVLAVSTWLLLQLAVGDVAVGSSRC